MLTYVSVDIEADGPVPGLYSMLSLGAVTVVPASNGQGWTTGEQFYSEFRPLKGADFQPEALKACGFTREQSMTFPGSGIGMMKFRNWCDRIKGDGRLLFVSDNAGFDWSFVNYYFWYLYQSNPFGHSSLSLTSFYKGFDRNMRSSFKHLRKTRHSHNALDDAMGNAEALVALLERMK